MPYNFGEENEDLQDATDGLDPDTQPPVQRRGGTMIVTGPVPTTVQRIPQVPQVQIQEQEADAIVSEVNEEVERIDIQMSEAERRLELAQYYKLVLRDNLFEDDSESAQVVTGEIREFIRTRLAVLLGVSQEVTKREETKPLFDPEEIEALKALAARVLKRPAILAKPEPQVAPAPPALKRVEVTPPPRITPRPVPTRPTASPVSARTQSKVQPKPIIRPKAAKSASKYRTKADLPEGLREDPSIEVVDGKVFRVVQTEDGREVRQNITPQAKPKANQIQPLPMASADQQNMVNVQHAGETLRNQKGQVAQAINVASSGTTATEHI